MTHRVILDAAARALCGLAPLVLLWCAGCSGRAEGSAPGPTALVEQRRIERAVVATGTIEPEREVEVRSRIPGIVERLRAHAGESVRQGDLLMQLDRELLLVGARAARAELDGVRIELQLAERSFERVSQLHEQGMQSERQFDEARAARDAALAHNAQARARVEELDVQLRYSSIRAPISGKILDVFVEEGTAVAALTAVSGGTVLLKLAEEDSLHLLGLVDESEIAHVHIDQRAEITTEAHGGRVFAGRVRKIAPIGERRQNVTYFEVEVEVTEGLGELRPKMSGDARIVTDVVESALSVPENALVYEGDQIYVDVVKEGAVAAWERSPVRIGIVDGSHVEVVSGLQLGQRVRLR